MHCFTDKDIVDAIFSHPDLDLLAIAIYNAHFIPLLRNNKENITFFAPTKSGFSNDITDLIGNNQTETYQILSRHKVIGHGAYTTDHMRDHKGVNMTLDNYGGGFITLYKLDDGSITALEEKGFNKNRTIIERDIHASNGVIHVIDGIL